MITKPTCVLVVLSVNSEYFALTSFPLPKLGEGKEQGLG
jgi:hypothetical protein